jgi:hypothetical protein
MEGVHDAGQTANVIQAADFMDRMTDQIRNSTLHSVRLWSGMSGNGQGKKIYGLRLAGPDTRKAAITQAGQRKSQADTRDSIIDVKSAG